MIGDGDEAFPRHTQNSAKGKSCYWRSKGIDGGVAKPKLPKKVEKEGSGRTAGEMDQQDCVGQAWRWNRGAGKWVTRPHVPESGSHAPAHETQSAGEDRLVGDCLPAWFPPTGRSTSCASESEVVGRKKSSAAARRSDGDAEGFGRRRK